MSSSESEVVSSVDSKPAYVEDRKDRGKQVVIEVDASLFPHNQDHSVQTTRRIPSDDVSSTASVANKFGFFKISPSKGEDDESWSFVSNNHRLHTLKSVASVRSEDGSVATSTVSDFALLSLNGAPKRRCQRCFYLNGEDDDICGGCCLALMANDAKDTDQHSSNNLEPKDWTSIPEAVLMREKKRKALSELTILSRSSILVNDIERVVSSHGADTDISMLPVPQLVVLASRFVERADHAKTSGATKISVAYHFSQNCNSRRMGQIRQDSFGPGTIVSNNIEAAFSCSRILNKSLRKASRWRLPLIREGLPDIVGSDQEVKDLGWIVAIVNGNHTIWTVNVRGFSGSAELKRPCRSSDILPLVYFEASLRNQDIIRRLVNGLSQVCYDFFGSKKRELGHKDIEAIVRANTTSRKKPRMSSSDEDANSTLSTTETEDFGKTSKKATLAQQVPCLEKSGLDTAGLGNDSFEGSDSKLAS